MLDSTLFPGEGGKQPYTAGHVTSKHPDFVGILDLSKLPNNEPNFSKWWRYVEYTSLNVTANRNSIE